MTDEKLKPEEVTPTQVVETAEEVVEAVEEVVTEKVEEPTKEEETTEESAEVVEEVLEKEPELLKEVVDTPEKEVLEESLSVIKEVRTELANAYKTQKELSVTMEQLNKEVETLKNEKVNMTKTMESLNSELDNYKVREQEVLKQAYNKRLEQLSNNFSVLGQQRSIEQLSALGEEVITEFEVITNLALANRKEEKLSTLTMPTQAMSSVKPKEQLSDVKEKPAVAKKEFNYETLCNTLTSQQDVSGNSSKRIINL